MKLKKDQTEQAHMIKFSEIHVLIIAKMEKILKHNQCQYQQKLMNIDMIKIQGKNYHFKEKFCLH